MAPGAGRILDTEPERLAVAESLGDEAVAHVGEWTCRFDRARITVGNTGTPDGLTTVLRSIDDHGYCTSAALHYRATTEVPRWRGRRG